MGPPIPNARAADKAESLASSFGSRTLGIQGCTNARGRPPETLSLGWLPAVRFIPAERVSGGLPSTVELPSACFA
jgi:hypothetical protein